MHPARLVLLELQVSLELQALQARLEPQVQLVQLVQLVLRVQQELQVLLLQLARRVLQELLGLQELRERQLQARQE